MRWPVWTSLRLYRGFLDEIERGDYDVFNHRAYVAKVNKLLICPVHSCWLSHAKNPCRDDRQGWS